MVRCLYWIHSDMHINGSHRQQCGIDEILQQGFKNRYVNHIHQTPTSHTVIIIYQRAESQLHIGIYGYH